MATVQLVVPNTGTVDTRLMVWLMQLMHDGRHELHYAFPMYAPIASARNRIVREFLESPAEFDYLLMIDSDVVPESNPLDLVDKDLDIVGQICPIWKGNLAPGREVMWNLVPLEGSMLLGEGLARVAAIGTGCVLIARRVLEHTEMRAPFREEYDEDGVIAQGEDVSFCHRAREAGFEVWADLGARCSHNRTVDLRQVGNAILTRHEQPILSPRLALGDKRLVFCLSPGRSGTQWLSEVLRAVPGCASYHEPDPNFADVMRAAQQKPELALQFWLDDKLPAISAQKCEIYAETSHLVNKGFLEPLIEMGLVPDVVCIERDPTAVALSYWRRRAIPGRTDAGKRYLIQPDDRGNCMPLDDWQELSDYQLCLWYALEQQLRNERLVHRVTQAGGRVAVMAFEDLVGDWDGFAIVCALLGLPRPDRDTFDAHNQVYNDHPREFAYRRLPDNALAKERELYALLRNEGYVWD